MLTLELVAEDSGGLVEALNRGGRTSRSLESFLDTSRRAGNLKAGFWGPPTFNQHSAREEVRRHLRTFSFGVFWRPSNYQKGGQPYLLLPDAVEPEKLFFPDHPSIGIGSRQDLSDRMLYPYYVLAILRLAGLGDLDRLRRCASCNAWFLMKKKNQAYCFKACRRHVFNTSPMQREKNAEYQREYYAKNLSSPRKRKAPDREYQYKPRKPEEASVEDATFDAAPRVRERRTKTSSAVKPE